jgi:hypothetical protein
MYAWTLLLLTKYTSTITDASFCYFLYSFDGFLNFAVNLGFRIQPNCNRIEYLENALNILKILRNN